jgi:hypothetical protein
MIPLFEGDYSRLKLYALEPHDLALTKLGRDWPVDRADIRLLARAGLITSDFLTQRYRDEMRSYLANPDATTLRCGSGPRSSMKPVANAAPAR